jgi:hypothetical protein
MGKPKLITSKSSVLRNAAAKKAEAKLVKDHLNSHITDPDRYVASAKEMTDEDRKKPGQRVNVDLFIRSDSDKSLCFGTTLAGFISMPEVPHELDFWDLVDWWDKEMDIDLRKTLEKPPYDKVNDYRWMTQEEISEMIYEKSLAHGGMYAGMSPELTHGPGHPQVAGDNKTKMAMAMRAAGMPDALVKAIMDSPGQVGVLPLEDPDDDRPLSERLTDAVDAMVDEMEAEAPDEDAPLRIGGRKKRMLN